MEGFDTRYIRGQDLIPISWEMARAVMNPKAQSADYYAAVLHVFSPAALILPALQRRAGEGLSAICTIYDGEPFICVAVRKSAFSPIEYNQLVQGLIGAGGALEDGHADLWAPSHAIDAAAELAVDLLTGPPADEDLAMRG